MSKLFENIKGSLYHLKGADAESIIEAENKLGLRFSEEFRNYLMEYGEASFGSHEFLGLGGDAYLDVAEETIRERRANPRFPKNCYLIENLGIDGILILQDEAGKVYELNDAGMREIAESMQNYVSLLTNNR